jgi:hypothetical protein
MRLERAALTPTTTNQLTNTVLACLLCSDLLCLAYAPNNGTCWSGSDPRFLLPSAATMTTRKGTSETRLFSSYRAPACRLQKKKKKILTIIINSFLAFGFAFQWRIYLVISYKQKKSPPLVFGRQVRTLETGE